MTAERYSVQLTKEEIDCVRASLDHLLKRLGETPLPVAPKADRDDALMRRQSHEAVVSSIKKALTASTRT
jgi:hypothetical protein